VGGGSTVEMNMNIFIQNVRLALEQQDYEALINALFSKTNQWDRVGLSINSEYTISNDISNDILTFSLNMNDFLFTADYENYDYVNELIAQLEDGYHQNDNKEIEFKKDDKQIRITINMDTSELLSKILSRLLLEITGILVNLVIVSILFFVFFCITFVNI